MASEMAESESGGLKRLGFARVAAIEMIGYASSLYDYVKQRTCPIGSVAGKFESVVFFVAGPVCNKLKPVAEYALSVLDTTVDFAANKFDSYAPSFAQRITYKAHGIASSAREKAHKFITEAQTKGPKAALSYVAEETKQLVIEGTANVWVTLHKIPVIRQLARKAGPVIAFCSKMYNRAVRIFKRRNLVLLRYLPMIPVDNVAMAIKRCESGKKEDSPATEKIPDHMRVSSSDSESE